MATSPEPNRIVRTLVWVVIALALLVVIGTGGYIVLEGWSLSDALYMTVITITTVGYGEIRPLDDNGRMFTMAILLVGAVIALIGISLTAALIAEGELGGRTRRRRMERRIHNLDDHYIICAYGRVGRAAVREIEAAGLGCVVIDPKEELQERLDRDGVLYLLDDCTSEDVLRMARIDRARALVCAVDSDATNVYVTLTARQINQRLFIVARSSEPGSGERLLRAGADRVVSPYESSGRQMVRLAQDPSILDLYDEVRPGSSIPVEERVVEPGSQLVGRKVSSLPEQVLAVRKPTGAVESSPHGDRALEEGDVVLVLRDERAGNA
jgi:voltage-gated potassium channel